MVHEGADVQARPHLVLHVSIWLHHGERIGTSMHDGRAQLRAAAEM